MKTLRFAGSSDDTFGDTMRGGVDHDNCASGEPIMFIVQSAEHRILVFGKYAPGPGPCWVVGYAPVDEDDPFPPWRFTVGFDSYSGVLEIEVPDETTVKPYQEKSE